MNFPQKSRIWITVLTVLSTLQGVVRGDDPVVVVTKVDGSKVRGQLTAWDAEAMTVRTEDQPVTIDAKVILNVRWSQVAESETTAPLSIELVDGSRFQVESYEVEDGKATIATPLAEQPLTLSTRRIASVEFAPDAPQFETNSDVVGDVLVVRKKKADSFDNLTGILGDVTGEQVQFTWEGEAIPVKRDKVAALVYFHSRKDELAAPVCWLRLVSGARLPIVGFSVSQGNVAVETPSGLEFVFPLDSIQEADYSQGKLAYLSDLRPVKQEWTPRIGLPDSAELIRQHGLPRRDQSFAGSALTLCWPPVKSGAFGGEVRAYDKGLAIRSRTELRYRLPDGMTRFVALAGIDPLTASEGHVTLAIFADQQSIWEEEIDGTAAPTQINVDVSKARELRIVVDYGANLDFGDRLHLAEARVTQ